MGWRRGELMSGEVLLGVDVGLRCGLAGYGADGRLLWYRSRNFGTSSRLKKRVRGLLHQLSSLELVVLEGGGSLARHWVAECRRRGIGVMEISAEDWRRDLLRSRDRRSGADAKQSADVLARRVIEWAEAPKPTSLRHDAAEAILVGLWAAHEVGLLTELPSWLPS
jgi:hypothetical protein